MLREAFANPLEEAMKTRNERAVGAGQLILATLKERDFAARGGQNTEGIRDPEITATL